MHEGRLTYGLGKVTITVTVGLLLLYFLSISKMDDHSLGVSVFMALLNQVDFIVVVGGADAGIYYKS